MFGNRTCGEVESLLWNYAARRVSEEDIERVETHLKTCSKCREQAEAYRQTIGAVAAFRDQSAPPSQTNWQDLQARLAAQNPTPAPVGFGWRIPSPVRAWGTWGSVAVAAGLLLFVLNPFHRPTTHGIDFVPAPDSRSAGSGKSEDSAPGTDPDGTEMNPDMMALLDSLGKHGAGASPQGKIVSLGTPVHHGIRHAFHPRHYRQEQEPDIPNPETQVVPASEVDGGRPSGRAGQENYVLSPVGYVTGQESSPDYVMGSVVSSRRSDVSSYEDGRGW